MEIGFKSCPTCKLNRVHHATPEGIACSFCGVVNYPLDVTSPLPPPKANVVDMVGWLEARGRSGRARE